MGKYIVLVFLSYSLYATDSVNIGIYNNPPKIFFDTENRPAGFFVDLIDAIAQEAHWDVHYVPCQWEECLQKLESGEIDMMPDVAYSKTREARFDFNDEGALSSWSVVYTHSATPVSSILDLHGKHVAVLKNSIQTEALKHESALYDIKPIFLEVDSFKRAFELLKQKKVDAAIVNNFYNEPHAATLYKTTVVLNPVVLKFALTKGANASWKQRLDEGLKTLKNDPQSAYYRAKAQWLDTPQPLDNPTPWLPWIFGFGGLLVLLLTLLLFRLKHRLNAAIASLKEAEQLLFIQSRSAAMGEMITMIAHQWKQPLALLSAIANQIKIDGEVGVVKPEKFKRYYDDLSMQIVDLARTIDDFKDYFKPNKAKELIDDPKTLIDMTLSLIGKTFEHEGIEVRTSMKDVPPLYLYKNDFIHVLLNLLNNAHEAFAHHATHKYVAIRASVDVKNCFSVEVEDNAGGIDAEVKKHIFEPCFTTKTKSNGTGLGLYMSQNILKNYFHGRLSVSSEGAITCFTISIPLEHVTHP